MRRHEGDVRPANDLLVGIGRHRTVGERPDAVGHGVRAGEHREHAGGGARGRRLDAPDVGVRVGRADEARVDLAGDVDVVAVAAVAHEQTRVVLAKDRLADSLASRSSQRPQE